MKSARNTLCLTMLLLAAGACHSEVTGKPEAQVVDRDAATPAADPSVQAAGTASTPVIKEKSSIRFVGAKVTGDHTGNFGSFDGRIDYAGGQPQRIVFEVDMNTAVTDAPKLDQHLRSEDFFDAARYPKGTFTSTSIAPASGRTDGATHMITGDLTLRGKTNTITFPAKVEQAAEGLHATSEFTIDRHQWDISYKGAPDNLIRDEVLLKLDLWFPPPPRG